MPNNNFEMNKGDDRMLRIYVKDENLDFINLNGAEARLYISDSSKASSYLVRKTTNEYSQGVIRTPERGEIVFFLTTDDTKDLEASQYFFQSIVIMPNGKRYTVCSGYLNLRTNLEYSEVIEPDIEAVQLVDIPVGASKIDLSLAPLEMIFPSLLAPSQSSENIGISNLVYSGGGNVSIYFTASIQEAGWRLSYLVSTLPS